MKNDFVKEARAQILRINFLLDEPDSRDDIFCLIHSIKGNANAIGWNDISIIASTVEELLLNQVIPVKEIRKATQQLSGLLETSTDGTISLHKIVEDLSMAMGKKVVLNFAEEHVPNNLRTLFIQLLINSLDHGIERPQDRLKARKPETATIHIITGEKNGFTYYKISDDGRGIQPAMSESIFNPGFTTKETPEQYSGRGYGLVLVKKAVDQLGGEISVMSEPGEGCSFTLKIPLSIINLKAS